MKRITGIPLINPTDNSAIGPPKLSFGTQPPKPSFPTGGLFSRGSIKFSLNNMKMVNLAKEAFLDNSAHKDDVAALNNFLLCLSITSAFEGGFDSMNTYDKAGISIGFIQFARPEAGAGRLLELAGRQDLADKIRKEFGTADPHNSPAAMKARFNKELLSEIVIAISGEQGIKAQMAMAINKNLGGQFYFEKAYNRFLELKLKDPLCCAILFDGAVNMGANSVAKFPAFNEGSDDGNWIKLSIKSFSRPERITGWQKLLSQNFA